MEEELGGDFDLGDEGEDDFDLGGGFSGGGGDFDFGDDDFDLGGDFEAPDEGGAEDAGDELPSPSDLGAGDFTEL